MENSHQLDPKELARRIKKAMDERDPPVQQVAVANACNVSSQAVYQWRKNGRVQKGHLAVIARLTGKPIEYFVDPHYQVNPLREQASDVARRWMELPPHLRQTVLSSLDHAETLVSTPAISLVDSKHRNLPNIPTLSHTPHARKKSKRKR